MHRSQRGDQRDRRTRASFAPEHPEFWLYPTWVHQAEQGLRTSGRATSQPVHRMARDGSMPIRGLVRVDLIGYVERRENCCLSLRGVSRFHGGDRSADGFTIAGRASGFWALESGARSRDSRWCRHGRAGRVQDWVFLEEPLPTSGLRAGARRRRMGPPARSPAGRSLIANTDRAPQRTVSALRPEPRPEPESRADQPKPIEGKHDAAWAGCEKSRNFRRRRPSACSGSWFSWPWSAHSSPRGSILHGRSCCCWASATAIVSAT